MDVLRMALVGSGRMGSFHGETIARRILRDDVYAKARTVLADQCGEVAARIHQVPRESLAVLPTNHAR